jgi:hypothetical protein
MKKIMYSCMILSLMSIQSFADLKEVNIIGLDGRGGIYDQNSQTAFLSADGDRTVYTDVVEYSQAVTPPSVQDPRMKPFATMPNSRYSQLTRGRMGGQKKTITLYGIPQYSTEVNEMPVETMRKATKEENTFEIFGAKGSYNSETKTAYLIDAQGKKKEYTNVIEYRQAVTPPSVGNPKMKAFATMPNPQYKERDTRRAGGQLKNIILYGIEKNSDDNFVDDEMTIQALKDNF